MMKRLLSLSVLLLVAAPATAEDLAGADVEYVLAADCAAIAAYLPGGADYVPGVAVDGSAVAPADLDGGHRYGLRPVYEFDITLDPVAALNPAFASTTQMAVARVRIDMATGRMTIDGHDVAGADHAVAEACARLHHKSVK